jgi:hypothetical protein
MTTTRAADLKPGDVFNWHNEGREVVAVRPTRGNRLLVDMCHPLFPKDTSLAIIAVDRELEVIG